LTEVLRLARAVLAQRLAGQHHGQTLRMNHNRRRE
jgi:hypothetical protein